MRPKDEEKVARIYDAAIKVVNKEGLQGASMSKIALAAEVSPATIYLYFDNKEDMIKKLFLHLKSKMGHSYYKNTSELSPSKSTYRILWLNYYEYISNNTEEYQFLQNFSNCPLIRTINKENIIDYCSVFEELFTLSKEKNIIRNISNDIIYSTLFAPVSHLFRQYKAMGKTIHNPELIEIFETAWKAIEKK